MRRLSDLSDQCSRYMVCARLMYKENTGKDCDRRDNNNVKDVWNQRRKCKSPNKWSTKLAQREYKRWHDNVARFVHCQLCGTAKLEWADRWYKHTPQQVVKNAGFKVLWDFNVQCDRMVEAKSPDIILSNGGQDHQHCYQWRCTSKRQKTGENREVPTSSRRNRKVVEAEESDSCSNCERNIRSCIRYVWGIHRKDNLRTEKRW